MYNNGDANLLQYIFNKILLKQEKFLPSCRYIKAEDRWGTISVAIFFVIWYRHRFRGNKLSSLSRRHLAIWGFLYEGPGIYPIWTNLRSFCLPWMGRPKYLDQNNQWISSIQFFSLLKLDQYFPPFRKTRLEVSKTDPVVIGSSCKRCEMFPLWSSSIYFTTTSFHCQDIEKNLKVHFELRGTQDMIKTF